MFPVQYLVPSVLTRAVLCARKEAWKRRPFLLSSQICSNYRITSICGSLAAFSLPPPHFSPVFSHSLSLLSFAFSPFPFFSYAFFPPLSWLALVHSVNSPCKNRSLSKVYENHNILAFLANEGTLWSISEAVIAREGKKKV